MLGVDADAFGPDGKPVVGELGELVIKQPMPSMPVGFWNDTDGSRYREAYFDFFPGVWRFGDWILFTERGSAIITGRSDATLNRGGVRLGTSEIYSVVEEIDEVLDSLVVHLEEQDELLLFVVLRPGIELDDELRKRIAGALRNVALAAARAGHDRRRSRDPAHAHREEARGPGQAHPHGGQGVGRRRERRARRAGLDRAVRRLRPYSTCALMPLHGLDHVLVLTDDLEATRAFYCDVLGFEAGERPQLAFPGYWLYLDGVACVHVAERAAYEAHAAEIGSRAGCGSGRPPGVRRRRPRGARRAARGRRRRGGVERRARRGHPPAVPRRPERRPDRAQRQAVARSGRRAVLSRGSCPRPSRRS